MSKGERPQIENMAAGEYEARKAFEETTVRNMHTVVEFSQDTRKIVRELEEKILRLQNVILSKETQIQAMQQQIATLLQNKYNEGT